MGVVRLTYCVSSKGPKIVSVRRACGVCHKVSHWSFKERLNAFADRSIIARAAPIVVRLKGESDSAVLIKRIDV